MIELHRMLFPENEKWCIGWNGFFDEIHKQAIERETEGVKINMPQPTDHLFFQFCHARKHLLASGVGIRQICDILLFAEYYEKEIDWEIFLGSHPDDGWYPVCRGDFSPWCAVSWF